MTKVTQTSLQEGGLNRRRIHLREISGEADSPLETVGQDLRAARQRRGDDLATVSRNLKIRKDHLEALEEDNFEALPGRTYAVGFVRTYADYLGLDPAHLVERFKTEIAGRSEAPKTTHIPPDEDERKLPQGWIIIAVVVLGLLAYGAYHLAFSSDTLVHPPIASVPAPLLPKTHTKSVAQHASRILAPVPAVHLSQTPPSLQQAFVQAPSAIQQSAAQIFAALPKGQTLGLANQNPRIILRVRSDTNVSVQDQSGRVFIDRIMHPGDSYQVPDKVGLTLTAPNGGAVGIELDGQAMGFAGSPGANAQAMSLDPQAIADRFGNSKRG